MPHKFPLETVPALVKDFATYKIAIQNCSKMTVDEYLSDLRLFLDTCMLKGVTFP